MGLALVLRELSTRRRLLALGVLVAAVASILSVYRFEGGSLKPRSLQYSAASTQVLVDTQSSVLGNFSQSFEPLSARALVYANFMTSPAVLDLVGQQVGLSGAQIYAAGPVNAQEPRVEQEPTALKRNVELTGETKPYRLGFESQQNVPTISINSQAPTTAQAVALANAAAVAMQRYVATVETANGIPPKSRVVIRQLGPASGSAVNSGISKALAGMVFVAVFGLWCVLMLASRRFRVIWRQSGALHDRADEWGDEIAEPGNGAVAVSGQAARGGRAYDRDDALFDDQERASFDLPSGRDEDRPSVPASSVR
jgi:hypothetical protein